MIGCAGDRITQYYVAARMLALATGGGARMPREYARSLLGDEEGPYPPTPDADRHALATIRHYRSLVPLA